MIQKRHSLQDNSRSFYGLHVGKVKQYYVKLLELQMHISFIILFIVKIGAAPQSKSCILLSIMYHNVLNNTICRHFFLIVVWDLKMFYSWVRIDSRVGMYWILGSLLHNVASMTIIFELLSVNTAIEILSISLVDTHVRTYTHTPIHLPFYSTLHYS